MNFNGKIADWETKFKDGSKICGKYADAYLKLLLDIRDAVSIQVPTVKVLTFRGLANTYATGGISPQNGNVTPNTYGRLTEIPAGQEYVLKHVGCNDGAGAIRISLDGRVVGSFTNSVGELNVVIGPGELQVTGSADNMDYMVQLVQRNPETVETNNRWTGFEPNPGLPTGGRVDPDTHYDTTGRRIETPQTPYRDGRVN